MNSLGIGFDTLLTRGALCALMAAGVWSVVVVTAVAVEARTRGRIRIAQRTGCPAALRMWLLGVFVVVFAGGAPAQASDTGSGPDTSAVDSALDGLPLPDRAVDVPTTQHRSAETIITVRRGDSLWQIARRLLPVAATDTTVADTVTQVYAENRSVIGSDPDLVLPGQLLRVRTHSTFPVSTTPTEEP